VSGFPGAVNRPGVRHGRIVEAAPDSCRPGAPHGMRAAV